MAGNPWEAALAQIHTRMDKEDYRRWFGSTAYASDSGDQITVWVPTETIRRHISSHFQHYIDDALTAIDRPTTHVRFVVTGIGDEEEDENA